MSWPRDAAWKGGMAVYAKYGNELILRNRKSHPRRSRFRERKNGVAPGAGVVEQPIEERRDSIAN